MRAYPTRRGTEAHEAENRRPPRFADLPDIVTPAEVIAFLPIGRNSVYDLLKSGAIKSVRIGQKYLIWKAALGEYLGGSCGTSGLPGPHGH